MTVIWEPCVCHATRHEALKETRAYTQSRHYGQSRYIKFIVQPLSYDRTDWTQIKTTMQISDATVNTALFPHQQAIRKQVARQCPMRYMLSSEVVHLRFPLPFNRDIRLV